MRLKEHALLVSLSGLAGAFFIGGTAASFILHARGEFLLGLLIEGTGELGGTAALVALLKAAPEKGYKEAKDPDES